MQHHLSPVKILFNCIYIKVKTELMWLNCLGVGWGGEIFFILFIYGVFFFFFYLTIMLALKFKKNILYYFLILFEFFFLFCLGQTIFLINKCNDQNKWKKFPSIFPSYFMLVETNNLIFHYLIQCLSVLFTIYLQLTLMTEWFEITKNKNNKETLMYVCINYKTL